MTSAGVDLLTVVMHELGHLLGLDHSDDPHDLMAPMLRVSAARPAVAPSQDSAPVSSALRPVASALHVPLSVLPSFRDGLFTDLTRHDNGDEPLAALLETDLDALLTARTPRSGERADQARVPRRSRMERYKQELDAWFAELASEMKDEG